MNAMNNKRPCQKTRRFLAQRLALGIGMFLPLYVCAAPSADETTPTPFDKWQSATPEGADTLTLSLRAENPVKGWMKTHVPVLTIQCSKGKPAVYVETGMPLEVTQVDKQIIRIQLDDNKPYPQRWREMGNATVFANPRDSEALIKQLIQAKIFVFEFIPFSSPSAQAKFAVAGLSAYLPKITRLCW